MPKLGLLHSNSHVARGVWVPALGSGPSAPSSQAAKGFFLQEKNRCQELLSLFSSFPLQPAGGIKAAGFVKQPQGVSILLEKGTQILLSPCARAVVPLVMVLWKPS